MPIDPRISLGVQPMQLPMQDPNQGMNALARAMQIKNSMAEGDMNALKMQELQRGVADTNKLNALYSGAVGADGAIDRNKLYSSLASGNLGSKIPAIQKQFLEADEARGKVQEQARKGYTFFQQQLGSHFADPNATPQSVAADLQGMVQAGAIDPGVAQKLTASIPQDPAQLKPFLRQVLTSQMTPEQMLTIFAPKATEVDNGQQKFFRDTNPNSPTYGQNTGGAPVQKQMTPGDMATNKLGYARLGEEQKHNRTMEGFRSNEVTQGKTQIVETPEGFVIVDKNSGASRPAIGPNGQPLKGKANDRVLTDAQAKANLFGTRMRESDAILSQLEDKGVTNSGLVKGAVQGVAGMTPFMGDKMSDAAGSLMNTMPRALGGPNSDQQRVEQARRDFLNAVLRRESGAVISPQEFANAERQYFPQPGDGKEVLEQKRKNRKLAISGLEAEVPGGFRNGAKPQTPAVSGGGGGGNVIDFGSLK